MFDNWIMPSQEALAQEYHVECVLKGHDFASSEEHFLDLINRASIIEVSHEDDAEIAYRSRTKSKEQLHNLIKGYASYPQFRNEKTLDALYEGFEKNRPMKMPIVIERNEERRVLAGNTRMDVAFQMGITPKVILVKVEC